ncbi:hypothetical protein A8924_2132 [Saccharopolyspora erythraea NRRL 2338]|nr:hypothetical protein A8924_2132 [Saccharopolyspora erythraea NRRL 2338]
MDRLVIVRATGSTARNRSAIRLFVVLSFLGSFLAAHVTFGEPHEAVAAPAQNVSTHCAPQHEHDPHVHTAHGEICFASSRDLQHAELPAPVWSPAVEAVAADDLRVHDAGCTRESPVPVSQSRSGRALLTRVCITRV